MESTHPLMEGGGFNHVSGKYLFYQVMGFVENIIRGGQYYRYIDILQYKMNSIRIAIRFFRYNILSKICKSLNFFHTSLIRNISNNMKYEISIAARYCVSNFIYQEGVWIQDAFSFHKRSCILQRVIAKVSNAFPGLFCDPPPLRATLFLTFTPTPTHPLKCYIIFNNRFQSLHK